MTWRRILVVAATAMLTVGTVAVFLFFDARSHSNSDTLRPFIVTVVPAWIALLLASRVFLTRRRSG